MRYIFTLLCVLLLGLSSLSAQQRYLNQWSVGVTAGTNFNGGIDISAQAVNYKRFPSSIIIDLSYMQRNYIASGLYSFTVPQYLLASRYSYSINLTQKLSLDLGVGAVVGYENPPIETQEGKAMDYESAFIVGIDCAPQIDFSISRHFSIFVEQRVMYLFLTSFENFMFSTKLGIKIYM